MSTDEPLIAALRAAFAAHADAAQAIPMQAYMKSALPFYGIAAPLRRRLTADAVKAHPSQDSAALARTMRTLWRGARFREERYAAVELPRLGRAHPKLVNLDLLPLGRRDDHQCSAGGISSMTSRATCWRACSSATLAR